MSRRTPGFGGGAEQLLERGEFMMRRTGNMLSLTHSLQLPRVSRKENRP